MLNLNTHSAYRALRASRVALRIAGKKLSGWALATALNTYSERGADYVKSLHNIMRLNKLSATDEAYLWDKGRIIISPKSST